MFVYVSENAESADAGEGGGGSLMIKYGHLGQKFWGVQPPIQVFYQQSRKVGGMVEKLWKICRSNNWTHLKLKSYDTFLIY